MVFLHVWLLFPIIFSVLDPAVTQTNEEISKLETFYNDKCLKNTGRPESFETLRNHAFEMYKYFEHVFQFLPDNRKTFCDSEKKNLIHRANEIEIDLKACLSNDEKFLANFFKQSFGEFLHFFCHNNGENTRRFFGSEGVQCRKVIDESKTNDLNNCLNRIFAPSKRHITQTEMCDDITVTRKCFTQLLDTHCPSSYDFKRLNGVFFDYIGKPCSSCVNVINNAILIVLVLFNLYRLL